MRFPNETRAGAGGRHLGAGCCSPRPRKDRWLRRKASSHLEGTLMKRLVFESEHEQLRETTRQFIEQEVAPYAQKWERERIVDRSAYLAAGKYGLIGFNLPEKYGGGGSDDFRFNAVIVEELAKFGSVTPALSLQNDIVGPYLKSLASDEQQARWLPGYITGEIIGAIAMSEPSAGSDLAGIRTS